MQRSENPIDVNDYVVTEQDVPGAGRLLRTAQVIAATDSTLTVVDQPDPSAPHIHGLTTNQRTVDRKDVQSYADVYGTAVPYPGATPLVKQ